MVHTSAYAEVHGKMISKKRKKKKMKMADIFIQAPKRKIKKKSKKRCCKACSRH